MKTKTFLDAVDHGKVSAAIAGAERASSGQISVSVTHRTVDDVMVTARQAFARLGLERTAARNGVLILLAPESRKFAVLGDDGIHERCGGDEFWQKLVGETMRPLLREGRFTEAIVAAVSKVGLVLAEHFPPVTHGAHSNELPDEVDEDAREDNPL